jgi:hypothetical protein
MLRSLVIATAAVIAGSGCTANASEQFTFQVPQLYPSVASKWHAELGVASASSDDWLYNLSGVATPLRHVTVARQPMLLGSVCKMYDCGDNAAAILFAADGGRVVGMVAQGATHRVVGSPTGAESRCLSGFISRGSVVDCM